MFFLLFSPREIHKFNSILLNMKHIVVWDLFLCLLIFYFTHKIMDFPFHFFHFFWFYYAKHSILKILFFLSFFSFYVILKYVQIVVFMATQINKKCWVQFTKNWVLLKQIGKRSENHFFGYETEKKNFFFLKITFV